MPRKSQPSGERPADPASASDNSMPGDLAARVKRTNQMCTSFARELVDLDEVDLKPFLANVQAVLQLAQELAEWADDGKAGKLVADENRKCVYRAGQLGDTGANLLRRLYQAWSPLRYLHPLNLTVSWYWADDRRFDAFTRLRDLTRQVFRGEKWANCASWSFDPEAGGEFLLVEIEPGASLGLPHALFARRLAGIAERLEAIIAVPPQRRQRMTVEAANERALALGKEMGAAFFAMSKRQQAKLIRCSYATWEQTELFKAIHARRGAGNGGSKPTSPRTVSFTHKLQAVTGAGSNGDELKRLIAEQEHEAEPSPLEADPPDRPRRVREQKKL